jgi:hypothetical protein
MTKKLNILRVLALAIGAAFVAAPVHAQSSMTTTTLTAAMTARQSQVYVASATNINPPGAPISQGGIGAAAGAPAVTLIMVDREVMRVNAISGTTVQVDRGFQGTASASHLSGAKVYVAGAGTFRAGQPSGSCTLANIAFLPQIDVNTGNAFNCVNSMWTAYYPSISTPVVGAAVASASTMAPTGIINHVTGTAAVNTITLPAGFTGGCLTLIPDAIFTTGTSGNIALASTAVVGKALIECYDPNTSKFYPSY